MNELDGMNGGKLTGEIGRARGDYPGFLWSRLWQAFTDDATRLVELVLAAFFFLPRGVFLLILGQESFAVQVFLRSVGLNETRLGLLCLVMGVLHLYAAGTASSRLRAWVCACGIVLSLVAFVSFRQAPVWHSVAMIWLTAILSETYLAWRNFLTIQEVEAAHDAD